MCQKLPLNLVPLQHHPLLRAKIAREMKSRHLTRLYLSPRNKKRRNIPITTTTLLMKKMSQIKSIRQSMILVTMTWMEAHWIGVRAYQLELSVSPKQLQLLIRVVIVAMLSFWLRSIVTLQRKKPIRCDDKDSDVDSN